MLLINRFFFGRWFDMFGRNMQMSSSVGAVCLLCVAISLHGCGGGGGGMVPAFLLLRPHSRDDFVSTNRR